MFDQNKKYSFHLFTLAIVLLFLLPGLLQEGMFMDGLIYSTIAHNMANGIGSFYYPSFSQTVMPVFNEHPPLAMGIQSLFFKVLGDGFYIEKIYSFLCALFTMAMIILFWKKMVPSKSIRKLYWLPVLLWIIVPSIHWSFSNNMLENTMGLFALIATYLLLISIDKLFIKKFIYLILACIFIFLAFLTKGFPALYPLALYPIYYILYPEKISFKKSFAFTFISLLITSLLFFFYLYLSLDAYENFYAYFNSQVLSSIEGKRQFSSRWDLFSNLSRELIVPFILIVIIYLSNKLFSKMKIYKDRSLNKSTLFFLLLALASSLPLMVSPKQLSFYIVPSISYFALSMAMFISPLVKEYLNKINFNSWKYKVFYYFNISIILIVIAYSILNLGTYSRDKDLIQDIDKIANTVGNGSSLTLINTTNLNWSLITQFQRKYYINMDITGDLLEYLVLQKEDQMIEGYEIVPIDLSELRLLKKK